MNRFREWGWGRFARRTGNAGLDFRHALVALALGCPVLPAQAQTTAYPERPVRVLVGWAPGGAVDLLARFYGQKLAETLGQSFVIENRPGASSNIATDVVAKSKPDGYVLTVNSVVHSINPSLFSKLPYDAVKDFAPVSPVGFSATAIAIHPSVPARNLRELIALAKARPGALTFASPGGGTLQHLTMVMFNSLAGLKMLHVPYAGAGPSLTAILSGQVDAISAGYGAILPFTTGASSKLRMLAISSAERSPLAPEVPTIAEAGNLPGFEAIAWIGMLAPAGTPAAVVQKLNTEIGRIAQRPDTQEWFAKQGLTSAHESPAVFAKRVENDIVRYGKVVREVGAKAE